MKATVIFGLVLGLVFFSLVFVHNKSALCSVMSYWFSLFVVCLFVGFLAKAIGGGGGGGKNQ